jgi:DNA-binding XRE family transcriptional regulator
VSGKSPLAPLPETHGQTVIVLAPVEMPAELPDGFEDIDTIVEREERDPLMAEAFGEARRLLAEKFYGESPHQFCYYRLRMGWSQKQLAEKANTSQSYIARLEAGDVDPQVGTLRRLARVLKTPVATLLDALPERN